MLVNIYCLINGLIKIGPVCPEGSLLLGQAEEKDAIAAIDATLSQYEQQRIIPINTDALDALVNGDVDASAMASYNAAMDFKTRLQRTLRKGGNNNGEK